MEWDVKLEGGGGCLWRWKTGAAATARVCSRQPAGAEPTRVSLREAVQMWVCAMSGDRAGAESHHLSLSPQRGGSPPFLPRE